MLNWTTFGVEGRRGKMLKEWRKQPHVGLPLKRNYRQTHAGLWASTKCAFQTPHMTSDISIYGLLKAAIIQREGMPMPELEARIRIGLPTSGANETTPPTQIPGAVNPGEAAPKSPRTPATHSHPAQRDKGRKKELPTYNNHPTWSTRINQRNESHPSNSWHTSQLLNFHINNCITCFTRRLNRLVREQFQLLHFPNIPFGFFLSVSTLH